MNEPRYVFLSYASGDRERAFQLADRLEAKGIAVWIDRKSIAGGTSWSAKIVEGIKGCAALVVLISPASVQSRNVQQEIQLAWEHERKLLPLLLERCALPSAMEYSLAGRQWVEVLDHADDTWLPPALRALAGLGVGLREAGAGGSAVVAPPTPETRQPATPTPNNLPASLTEFIGRRAELAEATRLLGTTRLLTLTGTGGCGKTRLALEVAGSMLEDYPDGVWLVELAALTEPGQVPLAVAGALGLREDASRSLGDLLAELLGSRRLLLVLDNCEHLVDSCARLAQSLLRGGPNLRILATSREALGIAGELAWRVPSLALPPSEELPPLGEFVQIDAVNLFVGRARAAAPAFALTAHNAPAVAQICRRLDGIPLALELAAARVKVLPVEQVAAHLDQRFRLLTGGSRAALPRQQTLAALVGWSYDLLSEAERTLFERLSVFAGGFTFEAVQRVCTGDGIDEWEALDLLQRLVEKSLVVVEEGESGAERYRLLETLRQYGREKLVAHQDPDALYRRHAEYFLGWIESYTERDRRDARLADWASPIRKEYDNLRQALRWAIRETGHRGADPALGLKLVIAVSAYWSLCGPFREAIDVISAAVGAATTAPPSLRARAYLRGGGVCGEACDFVRAETWFDRACSLASEAEDEPTLLEATMLLGAVMGTAHRDFARSEALLGDALALAERIGDRSAMGRLYTWLGRMSLRRDHLDQAGRYLERAQVIYHQEDENGPLPSHLIGTLGSLQFLLGNYDRAEEWFGKKLRWFQSSGISHIGGWAKNCLGMVAHARGDYATALGYFRQALEDDRAVAHLEGLSDALQRISKVAAAQGEPETAARLMGAVANLPFTPGSFEPALEHESYLRCVEDVRASLGEAAFDTAFAAGKSLRLDDAIAEARAYTARG